jgi:hypothetical protein
MRVATRVGCRGRRNVRYDFPGTLADPNPFAPRAITFD